MTQTEVQKEHVGMVKPLEIVDLIGGAVWAGYWRPRTRLRLGGCWPTNWAWT